MVGGHRSAMPGPRLVGQVGGVPGALAERDRSATVASTASALREATMTVAPAATKPAAIISPIPRVPPVTTTVFPATENSSAGGVGAGASLIALTVVQRAAGVGIDCYGAGREDRRCIWR